MFDKLLKMAWGGGNICAFPSTRRFLFLMLCFGASASFGGYQYIISGSPAANPSASAYSSAISLNAQQAGNLTLNTALETRYRTSVESVTNNFVFRRMKPGMMIIVH